MQLYIYLHWKEQTGKRSIYMCQIDIPTFELQNNKILKPAVLKDSSLLRPGKTLS
jgi:hypothetical protein